MFCFTVEFDDGVVPVFTLLQGNILSCLGPRPLRCLAFGSINIGCARSNPDPPNFCTLALWLTYPRNFTG